MGEAYFNLKHKLEELGFNNTLPLDAVPLVECILADLLQTTRSLQHYMQLAKEAIDQRDTLTMHLEPYKSDNTRLLHENNRLHQELMQIKEENMKNIKEHKRKVKSLTDEVQKKDLLITKLQHDVRDLSLRGLCAGTRSSLSKIRKKEMVQDNAPKICISSHEKGTDVENIQDLNKKNQFLEDKIDELIDETQLLRQQIENRDREIVRLNMMLEGGRPLVAENKPCDQKNDDKHVKQLMTQIRELNSANELIKKELNVSLEKQHEAMSRALNLADKNKSLQQELQKVDSLALKVEEDCNKRLATMMNELNFMQTRIDDLLTKNSNLEKEISQRGPPKYTPKSDEFCKEKQAMRKEISDLKELNKNLQQKIASISIESSHFYKQENADENQANMKKCLTKDDLHGLLVKEREKYEKLITQMQEKLNEVMHMFKSQNKTNAHTDVYQNSFVKELHSKLCDSEQKLLMLKTENDEMKSKMSLTNEYSKQNYKDIISQLNNENTELTKENIALSQQLSQYKGLASASGDHSDRHLKRQSQKLKEQIQSLTKELQILKKDKQEYILRYKEAMELVDRTKRDLALKQKEVEQLEVENSSYKMTNRSGKASVDHLRDECNFLREQIKRMQSDVIKEKTLANQIKNIQLETERSSNEIQNELLCLQKKLSLSKDNITTLENKCKDLQQEINVLKTDKANLVDNIRKLDQERDKLVLELDHKSEMNSVLEQKIKSQTFEISKLEDEISDLQRKLNVSRMSEHKAIDNEAQIKFLNGEILRLTQQFDNATIENRHLQNSLGDANGNLKLLKIEYEKSRKEVDDLKQQLQHYVVEIRRIEELLSQKEAERSDMLEHFASLSVEANILENTNHSLESASASKSQQLQNYVSKIQSLEEKILDKESIIDSQSARIASMTCRISALENEVKLLTEEKALLDQNIVYLKKMSQNFQSEQSNLTKGMGDSETEAKLYENRIRSLSSSKSRLEAERDELKEKLMTTEKLLSNSRRDVVELKLALQDATSETKLLQGHIGRINRRETETHENTLLKEELELPLMLEETIHEVSHEEDEDSSRYHEIHKRFSKYSHGSTL